MASGILSRRRVHGGRSRAVMRWFGLCLLAGSIASAGPAVAQDRVAVPPPALGARGDGVVTPPGRIDPGMTHAAPHLPSRSMPVLRPRTRDGRGVRIVPK